MKSIIKLRSNMKADIIGGLIFLILMFATVVYVIGYNIFTDAFKEEYTSVTHHMADSAAAIVNGDHIDEYLSGDEQEEYDALPAVFPPFPDSHEFDIYASMDPARGVGGDFYNFFFIDDDHLALVMADVSGKGIPGALFMMVTNILITETTRSLRS